MLSLRHPSPANLPQFTEAITRVGDGKADLDVVLCYARGGFAVR